MFNHRAHIVALHKGKWSDADRLPDTRNVSLKEIDWIARKEMAARLSDIVKHRTTFAVTKNLTVRDIETIADVASEAWDGPPRKKAKRFRS